MSTTVELERMAFYMQQRVSAELLRDGFFGDIETNAQMDMVAHSLVFGFRQYIYTQHLEDATVQYPASWIEVTKEVLAKWLKIHWPWGCDLLLRCWPVEYKTISIDVKALYPRVVFPEEKHIVKVILKERIESMAWKPLY